MKRLRYIIAGVLLLIPAQSAFPQLLYRENIVAENYGRDGYHKYGLSITNREANPRYDYFGNYLMDGVRAYAWTEEKSNYGRHSDPLKDKRSSLYKTNEINDGEYFRQHLNNIVVVSESQKAFSTRFIVGNEIRVKFSPLTVDMATMNGVRWDMNFNNVNNFTFFSSRADIPGWFSKDYQSDNLRLVMLPVYLTGAHYDRQVGILNIAANYVNTYKSDSSISRNQNSITGTISHTPDVTSMLVVKLEDASRFDGNGPTLFELIPVINGQERPELLVGITRGNWSKDFYDSRRQTNNPTYQNYENRFMIDPRRIPEYVEFNKTTPTVKGTTLDFLLRRLTSDQVQTISSLSATGQNYLQVNGGDYLQFWFEIPPALVKDIKTVVFKALVANTYRFSIAEVSQNASNTGMGQKDGWYFTPVKESRGNVHDNSNYGWVTFEYGIQTANMLMGLRLESHVKDFQFVAEYNRNLQFRQFESISSDKFRTDADAYYVNISKTWNRFTLGGEYFNIDSMYSTRLVNHDTNYFWMNSGDTAPWNSQFDADVSFIGGLIPPTGSSSSYEYMGNQMTIDTVDDNDDKDQYPDFHLYDGVRDMNGIFPGLDKNGNNRPDTNENDNQVPDYAEPFFLYNSDPDEYDYGLDMNNNGVIDEREDDDRPDYPYDEGTRGFHAFGTYGLAEGLKYTVGVAKYAQPGTGGEADLRYGRMEYSRFIPFFADILTTTQVKKVEDTIYDNVFKYARQYSTTLIDSFTYTDNIFRTREGIGHEAYYDQLDYRNSWVSTSYLDAKMFRIPNMTVSFKFKYDINHQNKTGFQEKNEIIERTQIVKADYRYYLEKLLIMPQVKFLSRKITNHGRYQRPFHEESFYPIVKLEYPLTTSSTLKFGAQGFPGLNSTVRNLVYNQLDYDERHYLMMITNRSLYQGYDFSLNFGYEVNWQDLHGIMRKSFSRTDKVLFIRLIVGMEPVS